jgi:hypothetical protein
MEAPSLEEPRHARPHAGVLGAAAPGPVQFVSDLSVLVVLVMAPALLFGAITVAVIRMNPRTKPDGPSLLGPAAASSGRHDPQRSPAQTEFRGRRVSLLATVARGRRPDLIDPPGDSRLSVAM